MKYVPLVLCLLGIRLLAGPLITEFQAVNQATVLDQFAEASDWIEITNPDAVAAPLAGWSLTDDPDLPNKWIFPAVVLQPGESLVVWASGRDLRQVADPLHTNFSLDGAGEYLALYPPAGAAVSSWQPYPKQFNGVSYGHGEGNAMGYFTEPTPGTPNQGSAVFSLRLST